MSDELTDQLRGSGRLDSSGSFTLNPRRAQQMMQQHLLEEPQLYVLCLVAAAVSHGATEVRVVVEPQRFELSYSEPVLTHEELESLINTPLSAGYLNDYLLGCQAALALRPQQIVIESGSKRPGKGHRLLFKDGKQEFREAARVGSGMRIAVTLSKGLFSTWTRGSRTDPAQLIRRRCHLAQTAIIVNGQRINQPVSLGRALAFREIYPASAPTPTDDPIFEEFTARQVVSDYRATLAVGKGNGNIQLVVHGIAFPFTGELEFPQLRGVIYCDELRKDLSQANLVQDQAFRDMGVWLRQQCRSLVAQLDENWEMLSAEQQRQALPYLDRLAELESRAGNLGRAQTIYERLLKLRAKSADATDPELLLNLSNLGTLYFLQSRHDQALDIFLAIAEDLQKLGRIPEAETYFERVLGLEAQVSSESEEAILKALVGWAECCCLGQQWVAARVLFDCARTRLLSSPIDESAREQLFARLHKITNHPPLYRSLERERTCSRCLSRKIIPGRKLSRLKLDGQPITANVCGGCGNIELAVADFAALWDEHGLD